MDARTDAEVIASSLTSPAAFGELFDRHATTMFRYFVRRVGPDDADSLLGELFRIAFEKRTGFDTERAEARPWLYGIASNLLARHRQGEARRLDATARLVNTSVAASDVFSDVDARLDASRLWADVAAAIATLPQGERDTLLLYAWEGMPYDQIASALDVPVGTVRSRLNRARGRLRELVGGERGRTGDRHPSPRPGPPRRRRRPRTVQAREGEAHVSDRTTDDPRPRPGAAPRRCTRASPTPTRSRRSSTSPACSSSPSAAKPGWAAATTTRACSPGSSSATAWS